jgi:hypothetical protein
VDFIAHGVANGKTNPFIVMQLVGRAGTFHFTFFCTKSKHQLMRRHLPHSRLGRERKRWGRDDTTVMMMLC